MSHHSNASLDITWIRVTVFVTHTETRKLYSISEEINKGISDHLAVCHTVSVHNQININLLPIGMRPSSYLIWSGVVMGSDLWIVGGLFYDLGCHPEWSAHKRVPLDLSVCKLACHAKVSQLHITLLWQQHISSCGSTRTHTALSWISISELILQFYSQCTFKMEYIHIIIKVPLMSLWIFFSECKYSSPLRISLSIVAIWDSSSGPGSSYDRGDSVMDPTRTGTMVHSTWLPVMNRDKLVMMNITYNSPNLMLILLLNTPLLSITLCPETERAREQTSGHFVRTLKHVMPQANNLNPLQSSRDLWPWPYGGVMNY